MLFCGCRKISVHQLCESDFSHMCDCRTRFAPCATILPTYVKNVTFHTGNVMSISFQVVQCLTLSKTFPMRVNILPFQQSRYVLLRIQRVEWLMSLLGIRTTKLCHGSTSPWSSLLFELVHCGSTSPLIYNTIPTSGVRFNEGFSSLLDFRVPNISIQHWFLIG